MQKPVTILRRPTAPTVPAVPADPSARAAAAVSRAVERALLRERARSEREMVARSEAMVRAMVASMEKAVCAAVLREAEGLAGALDSEGKGKGKGKAVGELKGAFVGAFESVLLGVVEESFRSMLAEVALGVDSGVGEVVGGVEKSSAAVGKAAGVVRGVEGVVEGMVKDGLVIHPAPVVGSSDDVVLEQVQALLDSGDVAGALVCAEGKSAIVRAKALSGALDAQVTPEDVFGDNVPSFPVLVRMTALLASDLEDRTEIRLSWLYEVVTSMDEAEDAAAAAGEIQETDSLKRFLEGAITHLKQFQASGTTPTADVKHVKLLVRVLKGHLVAME